MDSPPSPEQGGGSQRTGDIPADKLSSLHAPGKPGPPAGSVDVAAGGDVDQKKRASFNLLPPISEEETPPSSSAGTTAPLPGLQQPRPNDLDRRASSTSSGGSSVSESLEPPSSSFRTNLTRGMSYLWTVHYSVHRNFSNVLEAEDTLFWSCLIQGYSGVPFFLLLLMVAGNYLFSLLYATVIEVPFTTGGHNYCRMLFSIVFAGLAFRNVLACCYECMIDSTTSYPLLNPTMLHRLRVNLSMRPRGMRELIVAIHFVFAVTLVITCELGYRNNLLPQTLGRVYLLFLVNFLIKMVAWLLYIHPSSKSVAYDTTDDYYHQQRRSIRRLRKKVAINYVCFTDLALFMVITLAHYVVRPRLWTKDLSLQEVAVIEEQDVLAFNLIALVVTISVEMGVSSKVPLRVGSKFLERALWCDWIARTRQVSLVVAMVWSFISLVYYGILPAFFTLLVVFSGVSLSKLILWSCIECQRVVISLQHQQLPPRITHYYYLLPVLLGYAIFKFSWIHVLQYVIMLPVFAVMAYWATVVQRKFHYIDLWCLAVLSLAFVLACQQTLHSHWVQHIDNLFEVSLDSTSFTISSALGSTSMDLAPSPTTTTTSSPGTTNTTGAAVYQPLYDTKNYPFCDMKVMGLSLMDLTAMAFLAYFKNGTTHFHNWYEGSLDSGEWIPVYASNGQGTKGAFFIDMYSEKRNLSVVSVRGTNPMSMSDVFQDCMTYNAAFVWMVIGEFGPLFRWIPSKWTSYILYLTSLPAQINRGQEHHYYYDEVEDYVRSIIKERQVIMTGHSLGGGLSKIVAGRVGVPVFAVSSPGIALSHKIFGVPTANVGKGEINLYNSGDVVPLFDSLRGLIMQMRCPATSPLICHQIPVVIHNLLYDCGLQFSPGSKTGGRITNIHHRWY